VSAAYRLTVSLSKPASEMTNEVAPKLWLGVPPNIGLAGLKDAVTPAGRPLAVSATAPVKPLIGVTVIALAPAAP
jgi:hypothetical protein